MKLYKVYTTFKGANGPSHFYYDTEEKAQKFLNNQENGEIKPVEVIADYELNYSDGCTFNDLTFGEFDASEKLL